MTGVKCRDPSDWKPRSDHGCGAKGTFLWLDGVNHGFAEWAEYRCGVEMSGEHLEIFYIMYFVSSEYSGDRKALDLHSLRASDCVPSRRSCGQNQNSGIVDSAAEPVPELGNRSTDNTPTRPLTSDPINGHARLLSLWLINLSCCSSHISSIQANVGYTILFRRLSFSGDARIVPLRSIISNAMCENSRLGYPLSKTPRYANN